MHYDFIKFSGQIIKFNQEMSFPTGIFMYKQYLFVSNSNKNNILFNEI